MLTLCSLHYETWALTLLQFISNKVGATAHTAHQAMNLVRTVLQHRIISHFDDINWLIRSPDLSPCDFYLWGFLKSKVFTTCPADLAALKQRIAEEVDAIPVNTLSRVVKSMVN
jgi:hypothetical protein